MKKHFKLTNETKTWLGRTLYRIELTVDCKWGKVGDKGGWIEKDENLSGNAWVFGNARVSGNAKVFGNAKVYGNARVFGNAWVFGDARVFGNARVRGNARVYGDAWVYGDARVFGNAQVRGDAWVSGSAGVYGNAEVYGTARVYGKCTKTPLQLGGLLYPVTITDSHVKVGCEFHTTKQWAKFKDSRIEKMDSEAVEWWATYKDVILKLAEEHQK